MVWKLDSTELEFALFPGATVVESIVEGVWKLTELISLCIFLMNNSIGAV